MRITTLGHAAFAATIIGLGLPGLMKAFPSNMGPVRESVPERE